MIYDYKDYRAFIRDSVRARANRGRGYLSKIASYLRITSAQISHIMNGVRELTPEQSLKVAEFFGLNSTETEYFVELVALARAGDKELKDFTKHRLKRLAQAGLQLKHQVPAHRELSDSEKARFYSSWLYSAILLSTSIKPLEVEEVALQFNISRVRAASSLNFLLDLGLCVRKPEGVVMGPQTTFIPKSSPFVFRHHSNWRAIGALKSEHTSEDDIFFTSPVTMSKKDYAAFRSRLFELIQQFSKTVKESESEILACFNLDYFLVREE